MGFNSTYFSAKRVLIAVTFLLFCSKTMFAINPATLLKGKTIGMPTVMKLGYGVGVLCSVCLFGKSFKKLQQALTQLKFSKPDTLKRRQSEASCNLWGAASIGSCTAAVVSSALLFGNTVPDALMVSKTIGMAAAKCVGFSALAVLAGIFTLSRFLKPHEDRVDKLLGRAGPALVGNIAAGGAFALSAANAHNCIQLIVGKR